MVSPGPIRKRQLSSVGKNVFTQLITFLDESVLSGPRVYLKTIFFLSWIFSKILQGPPLVIFDCIIGSGDVHFPWILIFNNFTPLFLSFPFLFWQLSQRISTGLRLSFLSASLTSDPWKMLIYFVRTISKSQANSNEEITLLSSLIHVVNQIILSLQSIPGWESSMSTLGPTDFTKHIKLPNRTNEKYFSDSGNPTNINQ